MLLCRVGAPNVHLGQIPQMYWVSPAGTQMIIHYVNIISLLNLEYTLHFIDNKYRNSDSAQIQLVNIQNENREIGC